MFHRPKLKITIKGETNDVLLNALDQAVADIKLALNEGKIDALYSYDLKSDDFSIGWEIDSRPSTRQLIEDAEHAIIDSMPAFFTTKIGHHFGVVAFKSVNAAQAFRSGWTPVWPFGAFKPSVLEHNKHGYLLIFSKDVPTIKEALAFIQKMGGVVVTDLPTASEILDIYLD